MVAHKVLLPALTVTELATVDDADAIKVAIPKSSLTEGGTYYIRPKKVAGESNRRDGKPAWVNAQFNLFPVVLDDCGAPWPEANLWILKSLEGTVAPLMSTYISIAADLVAYRRFLDETGLDWLDFPAHKLMRPTYRFNGHLKHLIHSGEVSATTAKRRMATVIRFYRWLQEEGVLSPAHSPWIESDRYIAFADQSGLQRTKVVKTTDVSIRVVKQDDPYDGYIDDGGKLRPLPQGEQEWLLDALFSLGNTEMTLIHLFGLLTGARIQTILTFKLKHVLPDIGDEQHGELRLPIGPGTGIDTKHNKQLVLHLPAWFYRQLRTYALSPRSRQRRSRAPGGDTNDQYLFLSVRGTPLYAAQIDATDYDGSNVLRHAKSGQGVRQFIKDRVIPFIRTKYSSSSFSYRFHDTRATYGMNLVDQKLRYVEQGKATLKEVLTFVQVRLGHASPVTTERYLQYRNRLNMARAVQDGWEAHLEQLTNRLMQQNE